MRRVNSQTRRHMLVTGLTGLIFSIAGCSGNDQDEGEDTDDEDDGADDEDGDSQTNEDGQAEEVDPTFELRDFEPKDHEFVPGEPFDVSVTIVETAGSEGTTEVEYRIGDEVVQSTSVELAASEEATVTFEGISPEDLEPGEGYAHSVHIDGDDVAGTLQVLDPTFEVRDLDPTYAVFGEPFDVSASIVSIDGAEGTVEVEYRIGDEVVQSTSVELAASEEATVTFEGIEPVDLGGDQEYTFGVYTEDAEVTGTLWVGDSPWVEDGLQAYYPLDTDSLVDASGNGNDGNHRSGNTPGQPGVRDNAVEYHADDNPWSKLPHPISGEVTWSISLWFKQREGGLDANRALIGNYALSGEREARIGTWVGGDATLNVLVANQPVEDISSGSPFQESNRLMVRGVGEVMEDQWHHMVVSTTEEELRLYLDGNLLATSADEPETDDQYFDNEGAGEPLLADRNILALSHLFWGPGNWGDGWIDEVYIFDRALSDNEARRLYHGDSPE